MYSILIAEDSKPILRNIQSLLESFGLPIQVSATAANGEEALRILQDHPVDILFADIRMPKLSGLELIERAKPIVPGLKVVLISGYSDFEYTRKALSLQVFDYLLKPVKPSQLKDVMERLIAELGERRNNVTDRYKDILDLEFRKSLKLDPNFDDRLYMAFVICKSPFTPGIDKWTIVELEKAMNELFPSRYCAAWPTKSTGTFLAFVEMFADETRPLLSGTMLSLHHRLIAQGLHGSIAGAERLWEADNLPEFYVGASRLLAERLVVGRSVFINADASTSLERYDQSKYERLREDFAQMIRQRQKERFLLALSEQLTRFENMHVQLTELKQFLAIMNEVLGRMLKEHNPVDRFRLEESTTALLEKESYAEFRQALMASMEAAFDELLSKNRTSAHELFHHIDEYIKLNMYAQISITDLSQKFHVSPSYISRIVKRFSNRTFVQYYMDMKIKEACRLFADKPEMKIKDVSDALAFSDQHYFSKVFKDYTGYSPTEFKANCLDASAPRRLDNRQQR